MGALGIFECFVEIGGAVAAGVDFALWGKQKK